MQLVGKNRGLRIKTKMKTNSITVSTGINLARLEIFNKMCFREDSALSSAE